MKTASRKSAVQRSSVVLCVVFFFLSVSAFQVYQLSRINGTDYTDPEQQNAVYSQLCADCVEDLRDTFRSYFNTGRKEELICPAAYSPENSNFAFIARDANGDRFLTNYTVNDPLFTEVRTIMIECAPPDSDGVLEEKKVTVSCAVRRDLNADDGFRRASRMMQAADSAHWMGLVPGVGFGLLALVLCALCISDMFREAQRKRPAEEWMQTVPPDLFLASVLPAALFFCFVSPNAGTQNEWLHGFVRNGTGAYRFLLAPICMTGFFAIVFVLALLLIFSFRRGGWRYALSYKRFESVPFSHRTIVYFVSVQAIRLLAVALYLSQRERSVFLFLLLEKAVTFPVLFRCFSEIRTILENTADYAEGDLSGSPDTSKYYESFANHAADIRSITERISISADEYIRSSRFKAELITNLSHDIKTPLTSIINYAQLLENPKLPEAEKKRCLEVLDRHAQRMNKLVEDLTEVSDAQSGNIRAELTRVELTGLIRQAAAGFEERMQKHGLSLSFTVPDTPVFVTADTRLLWRVADNLLNNICKYAAENSVVQIGVLQREKAAMAVFRNKPVQSIGLSGEQLMERFVRGDSSRHTEGSGLGLSIAQSLMQLQGGRLRLQTENELFTAQVVLRLAPQKKEEN